MNFRIVLMGCLMCGIGLLPNSCDCSGASYYSDTTEEAYDSCALDSPIVVTNDQDSLNLLNGVNINNRMSLPQYYENDSSGLPHAHLHKRHQESGLSAGQRLRKYAEQYGNTPVFSSKEDMRRWNLQDVRKANKKIHEELSLGLVPGSTATNIDDVNGIRQDIDDW